MSQPKKYKTSHQSSDYSSDQEQQQEDDSRKTQNSLSLLTKKFIELIKTKNNYTIDLNEASKVLDVQKRRIYDITNVMEGVGYVQKLHKNTIRWIGSTSDPSMHTQKQDLKQTIANLKQKEMMLDKSIKYVSQRIQNDFAKQSEYNYINEQDCQQLLNNVFHDSSGFFIFKPKQKSTISSSQASSNGLTQIIIQSPQHISVIDFSKKQKGIQKEDPISI